MFRFRSLAPLIAGSLAALCAPALAQQHAIEGYATTKHEYDKTVADPNYRFKGLQGVIITICDEKKKIAVNGTRTDKDGHFFITGLEPGEDRYRISAVLIDRTAGVVYLGQAKASPQQTPLPCKPNPIPLSPQTTSSGGASPNAAVIALNVFNARSIREAEYELIGFPSTKPIPDASKAQAMAGKRGAAAVVCGNVAGVENGSRSGIESGSPLEASIAVVNVETGELIENITTARDGRYCIKTGRTGIFLLTVLANGYRTRDFFLTIEGNGASTLRDQGGATAPDNRIVLEANQQTLGHEPESDVRVNAREFALRYVASERIISSLPLRGSRTFDSFAFLLPGVLPPPRTSDFYGPGLSPGVGTPGQFSVNGLRSRENNFTVNGSDNNDEDIGVRRQGFVNLSPYPIEALEEFQITTALGDARYGRNIGAQVNVVSRTGGNALHGSVNGFLSSDKLNARNFFDLTNARVGFSSPLTRSSDGARVLLDDQPILLQNPSEGKNPFTQTQAGVAVGGPLSRLKTFFFASFDERRVNERRESNFAVPSLSQRGLFDTGETGFQGPSGTASTQFFPSSLPGEAIFSLYPFPNNPLGPYGGNTYTTVLPAEGRGRRLSFKIDHHFGLPTPDGERSKGLFAGRCQGHRWPWELWKFGCHRDALTASYNLTDEASILPVTGGALFSSLRPRVRTHNLAFFFNRTFSSTTFDTIRLSYGRTRLLFAEVRDPFLVPPSLLPDEPFLLNAPLLLNVTAPDDRDGSLTIPRYISAASREGASLLRSLGLPGVTNSEQITGPLGQILIAGFSPIGVDVFNFPQERANNTFQLAETLTKLRGKHIFTLGFDLRKTHINDSLDRNFRPLAAFNGLMGSASDHLLPLKRPGGVGISQDVLTGATLAAAGAPTALFHTLAVVPNSNIGIRFSQVNFFFQDEIRANPYLRFTWAIRYEVNTVPDTVGGKLERAFDRTELQRLAEEAERGCRACAGLTSALLAAFPADYKVSFGADRNDLDPRVGFAWDPRKNGKWAVRGGFGVYAGQFPGVVIDQSRNAFTDFVPLNLSNFSPRLGDQTYLFNLANPAVRQLLGSQLEVVAPGTLNTLGPGVNSVTVLGNRLFNLGTISLQPTIPVLDLVLPQRSLKTPYAYHYALTVEHQVFRDFVASLAYVGTRGIKLLRVSTPEFGLSRSQVGLDEIEPLGEGAVPSFPRGFFPFLKGFMRSPQPTLIANAFKIARTLFESSASSAYNSFQAEVHRRYSHHFEFGTAFTYSKTLDDVSDFFDTAGAFALPQNSLRRSERGPASFDAPLRWVTNFVWDVPYHENQWFGGWQLAGILTLQSGQPYTVNSAIDVNRDGNLTDRLNTTKGLISQTGGRIQLQLEPGTNSVDLLAADGQDGAVGRNTFRAPGIFTLDASLSKRINLGDRIRASLRAEAFNLFNRTHFGIPVRILEAPGFGSSVDTTIPARTIQFALKVSF